jgi:Flp pilus assembly protein TadD
VRNDVRVAPEELERLRRRSSELAGETSGEALEVNRAILLLVPADRVASNRLGIALLNLGEYQEAEEVFESAVEAHPDNEIATSRLEEVRRKRSARPVQPQKGSCQTDSGAAEVRTHSLDQVDPLPQRRLDNRGRRGHVDQRQRSAGRRRGARLP